jgi:hypothetical protein
MNSSNGSDSKNNNSKRNSSDSDSSRKQQLHQQFDQKGQRNEKGATAMEGSTRHDHFCQLNTSSEVLGRRVISLQCEKM